MKTHRALLELTTRGIGFHELTADLNRVIAEAEVRDGLAILFVRHTSASLLVQEGADPSVLADLERFFARLVPEGEPWVTHTLEGPDDMPSHIRSALTHTSEVIPVTDGRLALGTWQQVFLFEHRRSPRRRSVEVRLLGE